MTWFSAFAPFGMLAFDGAPPVSEGMYESLKTSYGPGYRYDVGTHLEASLYARAMCLADAAQTLERGENQRDPALATELIPSLERNSRTFPSETDTLPKRRAALAAKALAARGASRGNVSRALTTLLGADFLAYVPHGFAYDPMTPVVVPSDPSATGSFPRAGSGFKFCRLTTSVTSLGGPLPFGYASVDGTRLLAGEKAVIEVENTGLAELVALASAGAGTATATFANAHAPGATIRVGPTPVWSSTLRASLVVVSSAAARDPVTRAKINALMASLVRGVSTWSVVEPSGAGTIGPFTLGSSHLGTSTLSTTSYP